MTTPAAIENIQPIPTPLLEDQFVDMGFIARYTGLTDKWFGNPPIFNGR